jgi:hypothetical protein
MPEHRNVSLRGNIKHSPRQIALAFQNSLAYALGQITRPASFTAPTSGVAAVRSTGALACHPSAPRQLVRLERKPWLRDERPSLATSDQ